MKAQHLTLTLLGLLAATGCPSRPSGKLRVVASTTVISSVVEAVGGDRVEVTTVAPAGLCPGHVDIPPSAIVAADQARLLLNQGWEPWFPKLEQAVNNPKLAKVTLKTPGNWMVPPVYRQGIVEVTELLAQHDSANAKAYRARANTASTRVDSAAAEVNRMFQGRPLPVVIAADKQVPFLRWLGFRVVAVYGRPEDFTAQELSRLAQVGVDSSVGLVVDNLQSGPDTGQELARALGAAHVNLTNFPLEGDYVKSLVDNAALLASASGQTAP